MKHLLAALLLLSLVSPAVFGQKVSIKREVHQTASGYKVTVTIIKPGVTGYASYEDNWSMGEGDHANVIKDAGAVFKVTPKPSVKFLWTALPSQDTVIVSYTISVSAHTPTNPSAKFKFVYENEVRTAELKKEDMYFIR